MLPYRRVVRTNIFRQPINGSYYYHKLVYNRDVKKIMEAINMRKLSCIFILLLLSLASFGKNLYYGRVVDQIAK